MHVIAAEVWLICIGYTEITSKVHVQLHVCVILKTIREYTLGVWLEEKTTRSVCIYVQR